MDLVDVFETVDNCVLSTGCGDSDGYDMGDSDSGGSDDFDDGDPG